MCSEQELYIYSLIDSLVANFSEISEEVVSVDRTIAFQSHILCTCGTNSPHPRRNLEDGSSVQRLQERIASDLWREYQRSGPGAFQCRTKPFKPCPWDPASGTPVVRSFQTYLFTGDRPIFQEVLGGTKRVPEQARLIGNECRFCNMNQVDQRGLSPHLLADEEGKII